MMVPTPIFEICHIYDFLEVSIKKQALRHHRQVLDGLPAYKTIYRFALVSLELR